MTQSESLLGEVGKLISAEAADAIARMVALATGVLAETPAQQTPPVRLITANGELRPNTEHRTPNTVDARPARIYLRAPRLFSIEYIINASLGLPGAEIECKETTLAASERRQGAKCLELGIDNSDLLSQCDDQIKAALPIAIDRLFELAAGITIQRTRYGKPYTITCKPNCRAIEFIADRVAGKSTSVIGELRTRFENTPKEPDASNQEQQSSYRHPSPKIGRRDGDEGYTADREIPAENPEFSTTDSPFPRGEGGRGVRQSREGQPAARDSSETLPPHILTANNRLIDFLPVAIGCMKQLARGAQITIEMGDVRTILHHEPDARANAFLINRFMGAPSRTLQIERIVAKTQSELEIERLSVLYPDVIAHYGSADAAIAAYHAKYGA